MRDIDAAMDVSLRLQIAADGADMLRIEDARASATATGDQALNGRRSSTCRPAS